MSDKFHPTKLGDVFKDRTGKKWKLTAVTVKPTIKLEAEDGTTEVVTTDSGFARELTWYRSAGESG